MAVTAPIWKDTYYTSSTSALTYSIYFSNSVIYTGSAYRAPGEDTLSVNVSKICQNYLSNSIESLLESTSTSAAQEAAFRTFTIRNTGGTTLETYNFLYDWDYEGTFDSTGMVLSDPITTDYDTRMYRLYTVFDGSAVTNYKSYSGIYTNTNVCDCDYCLYYLGAAGGWNSFLLPGYGVRTDKITRYNYETTFDNTSIEFEKRNYLNEIKPEWKLNTGILDDDQAHNLCWNLIPSNSVYLHILSESRIVPVIITNTQAVYETYRNSDKQPAQYEITVSESQTKIRR